MNAPGPLTQLLDLQGMATAPDYSLRWVAPLADSHESVSLALLAPDGFHHALELEVAGHLTFYMDDAAHPLPHGLYLLHPHATDTSMTLPHTEAIRACEDQHAAAEPEQVHLVLLLLPGLHIEAAITGAEYDFVHLQLDAHVQ